MRTAVMKVERKEPSWAVMSVVRLGRREAERKVG